MLGGALHLDEAAIARLDDVHVGLGAHVLNVGQVQHGGTVDDAHGDRGDRVGEDLGGGLEDALLLRPGHRVREGHVGTRDRRGARATVGAQHVAVQDDRVLAERGHVDDATQGAANKARDLLSAAAHLALDGLAGGTLLGRAREHRVLAGHPALAGIALPARHALSERRDTQDAGVAELDENGALAGTRPTAGNGDGTELGRGAPIGAQGSICHSA